MVSKKATLCDLSKAFYCVPHKLLLDKLEGYGVRGTAHELVQSYLSNKYQYTSLNGANSSYQKVSSGICQGGILAPLFFIIYINDLPDTFKDKSVDKDLL